MPTLIRNAIATEAYTSKCCYLFWRFELLVAEPHMCLMCIAPRKGQTKGPPKGVGKAKLTVF